MRAGVFLAALTVCLGLACWFWWTGEPSKANSFLLIGVILTLIQKGGHPKK